MGCCKCESQAQVCQGGETERHKHRNLTEEKDLLKRLNRIEGQVRKLVQIQSKRKTTPVSSKLRGVVKLPKDFDYKKEMEERI